MKDWNKLYEHIVEGLENKLPPHLTYHNVQHTLYVLKVSEYIARQENVSEDDIILIKTAALFHDKGFIHSDENHEEKGVAIAKQVLPEFGYNDDEIEKISGMIRATVIPQNPKNLSEKILADADLEYLGTDNFIPIGNKLFAELKYKYPDLTLEKWNEIQINFLKAHHYHTDFCIQNRAPKKEENLRQLIENN